MKPADITLETLEAHKVTPEWLTEWEFNCPVPPDFKSPDQKHPPREAFKVYEPIESWGHRLTPHGFYRLSGNMTHWLRPVVGDVFVHPIKSNETGELFWLASVVQTIERPGNPPDYFAGLLYPYALLGRTADETPVAPEEPENNDDIFDQILPPHHHEHRSS